MKTTAVFSPFRYTVKNSRGKVLHDGIRFGPDASTVESFIRSVFHIDGPPPGAVFILAGSNGKPKKSAERFVTVEPCKDPRNLGA